MALPFRVCLFFGSTRPLWLCGLSLFADAGATPGCGGLLMVGASLVGHRLSGAWASVALQHVGSFRTRHNTRAPALAGGVLTTRPPGKPSPWLLFLNIFFTRKK